MHPRVEEIRTENRVDPYPTEANESVQEVRITDTQARRDVIGTDLPKAPATYMRDACKLCQQAGLIANSHLFAKWYEHAHWLDLAGLETGTPASIILTEKIDTKSPDRPQNGLWDQNHTRSRTSNDGYSRAIFPFNRLLGRALQR